jgi:hypothetical protein
MADYAAKIENCLPPQDFKQLQRFLGMVNFYCRFLPDCAQVLKPLTDLLKGGGQDFAMDRHRSGGFPTSQTPPSGGGATPTPRPKC